MKEEGESKEKAGSRKLLTTTTLQEQFNRGLEKEDSCCLQGVGKGKGKKEGKKEEGGWVGEVVVQQRYGCPPAISSDGRERKKKSISSSVVYS